MVDMPGTPVGDLPDTGYERWHCCRGAGSCTDPNHLCRMLQTGADLDRLKRAVRSARFICRLCGRVATRRDSLCRPEAL